MTDQATPSQPHAGPDVPIPGEWGPSNSNTANINVQSRITLDFVPTPVAGNPSQLQFNMRTKIGDPTFISGEGLDGLHFVIPADVVLVFELSAAWDWEFDTIPISFKRQRDARHYRVVFDPLVPRRVALHVRRNGGGAPGGESHSCSFNVKLAQHGGTKLHVKIDPEIKNPPPNQYTTIPAGQLAPL